MIQSARQSGQNYLQTKDKSAQKEAKKSLETAEKLMEKALEKNRSCEMCAEHLGSIYTLQSYFGISKDYDEAIKHLNSAHARYPQNPRIAFALGFSYYYAGSFPNATRTLNTFLALGSGDIEREDYARRLIQASENYFLTSWNNQADFYRSKESRIERFNPQTYQQEIVYQVTPEWENQIGSQAFSQLSSQGQAVNDPEITSYLDQLVQRVVQSSPGSPYAYQVHVVDTPVVNAVTVPGHVIVHTGLLRFAKNEGELAAIIGHELGHNYGHHAARRVIKAYQAQMLTNAVIVAINPQSQTSQLIANIAGSIGLGIFLNAYNRFEESEADRYGAHIAYNAGYSPTSMSSFLLHMYEVNPKLPIKWLSTHPPLPKRIEELTEYIENFPLNKEMRADSEAFRRIQAKVGYFEEPNKNVPPLP